MEKKINWGILSTAQIGLNKIIPAMQKGKYSNVYAICSRDLKKARAAAEQFGIPKAYGSYEELLEDDDIQAVYIPLPNHLHYEWTVKAMKAGKHVLCEKPLVLSVKEAEKLIALRDSCGVKAGEAFMVASHPQWSGVKRLFKDGTIGTLRTIQGGFCFYTDDPANIRNIKEFGGGAIFDVGCYPLMVSRMILGEEPVRLLVNADIDPRFGTDRSASLIVEFPSCTLSYVTSTQMAPFQHMSFIGTERVIDIPQPFNPPSDEKTRIFVTEGALGYEETSEIVIPPCDHYTLQGDEFSKAILEDTKETVPLENALAMARVYEAVVRSITVHGWADVQ
ncbi:Gfo/Idh/MocA family protein [Breznakiella homolactica]|uniref:Gfo/Idh/MocA family oxidoreductase n=1 Tax=Breznakiella homolactica TaxID=2798577 RepID=A0A7T7XKY6_9SPIR|nr:Gfo/Idh/MocA family oxidoreductase [Breznakiella homolactica]QQO08098.1 Gfo/Idh/MocA family oxidoreductase [Breznakiella homolactica]